MKFTSILRMPLDRIVSKTSVAIHPDFLADPKGFVHNYEIEVRKQWPNRKPHLPIQLDVLTFGGIGVDIRRRHGEPLCDLTIKFNPSKCLYGHNGSLIGSNEFIDAVGLLVHHLRPLLRDPADWVHLVPGVVPQGRAYWHMLEILLQHRETEILSFERFKNLHCPRYNPARNWEEETVSIGSENCDLRFCIYRKAKEMVARGKLDQELLADFDDILRIEARLKDAKLLKHLGSDRNTEVIDGQERVVRFDAESLSRAIIASLEELQGVFHDEAPAEPAKGKKHLAIGRLLARAVDDPRCQASLPELVSRLKYYTGAASEAISAIRREGLAELSRRSPLRIEDLVSEEAFRRQAGIGVKKLQDKVYHPDHHIFRHQLIDAAYRYHGQPMELVTVIPSYTEIPSKASQRYHYE